jgi:protein arginine N-methyltransferase 1
MENLIQQHAILLKDKIRMEAYRQAIEATVKPGDTVLDIGCGSGILSFLAIKAGAAHVHAVDVDQATLNLAKVLAGHNGLDKKITFHKGLSFRMKLKKKADVIVSELFGNLGLNENVMAVLKDARERLLKPEGLLIPRAMKLWIAPCDYKDWEYTVKAMKDVYGFDMLPDVPELDVGSPSMVVRNSEFLANSKLMAEVDFMTAGDSFSGSCEFEVAHDGILNSFAGWFEASLTDNVKFTTTPSGITTHWKQGFLPLRSPVKVRAGQKIMFEMEISPSPSGMESVIGYRYEIK